METLAGLLNLLDAVVNLIGLGIANVLHCISNLLELYSHQLQHAGNALASMAVLALISIFS